jgi:ATP-binding cassette subfamily F protein uup
VLEDSLAEFPGALVLVSHDRVLIDRLCTDLIGLDGRGGSGAYASLDQWLSAYERAIAEAAKPAAAPPTRVKAPSPKPRKLSYREQQEWDRIEADILAAEEAVVQCERAVQTASGHIALADACRALEDAQRNVNGLYSRWQELEVKRGTAGKS